MTRILLLFALFCSSFVFAQDTFSEKDAQQLIDTFFEGFHEGDTLKMKSVMAPDMVMQTAFTDKDGTNKITITHIYTNSQAAFTCFLVFVAHVFSCFPHGLNYLV